MSPDTGATAVANKLICPFEKDPTLRPRVELALDNQLILIVVSPQAYQQREGLVAHPPNERSRMALIGAVSKLGLQGLTPLSWPLASGRDYLIPMLAPPGEYNADLFGTCYEHLLSLVGLAEWIIATLQANASSEPSLPIELVLRSSAEVEFARALSKIRAEGGSLLVESREGNRIEIPLPDPRIVATPPLPEPPRTLDGVLITGVDIGIEDRHVVILKNGARIRLTAPEEDARKMLWPVQHFSGTAIHDGQDWNLDQSRDWGAKPPVPLLV